MNGISKLVSQTQIECMEFIMSTLHSSISNLKHAYSKESFRITPIYLELLALLNSLAGTQVHKDALKWRGQLFRALALLCYDDTLDDYRTNIRSSIQLIRPAN